MTDAETIPDTNEHDIIADLRKQLAEAKENAEGYLHSWHCAEECLEGQIAKAETAEALAENWRQQYLETHAHATEFMQQADSAEAQLAACRAALEPCSHCDYDEATGCLISHCAGCQLRICQVVWEQLAALAGSGKATDMGNHISTWRPISTAPKGGKWSLLWWPAVVEEPLVGYEVNGKWHAATGDSWPQLASPTHWMPLPPAPKEDKP